MAMNPWVKRKWLRALRSGEYGKGKSRLCTIYSTGKEYCCLGVLAGEMVPEFLVEAEGHYTAKVDGNTGYLPDDLGVMFGLDYETQKVLAGLNDQSLTFVPVIAYIETNL